MAEILLSIVIFALVAVDSGCVVVHRGLLGEQPVRELPASG